MSIKELGLTKQDITYLDVDWVDGLDKGRTNIWMFCSYGGRNLLSYERCGVVAKSNIEAKYRSMTNEATWFKCIMADLGQSVLIFMIYFILCDNSSTISIGFNSARDTCTKHIKVFNTL